MSTRSIIVGILLLLTACGEATRPPSVAPGRSMAPAAEHVDGVKAKELVAGGARLIDVRSADEYGAEHIEGAESAPVDTIDTRDLGSKDAALVVYCGSGKRSARAANVLRTRGYTRVYDLGAMSNWQR